MTTDLMGTRVRVEHKDEVYFGKIRAMAVLNPADPPVCVIEDEVTGRLCTEICTNCYTDDAGTLDDARDPKKVEITEPTPGAAPPKGVSGSPRRTN